MRLTQTKAANGKCNFKGWWQNELVVEASFNCRNFDSGLNLYIAGQYFRDTWPYRDVLDGQVRNFSYAKK